MKLRRRIGSVFLAFAMAAFADTVCGGVGVGGGAGRCYGLYYVV